MAAYRVMQDIGGVNLSNVADNQKIELLKKVNSDLRSTLDDIISILTRYSEAISIKFDFKVLLDLIIEVLYDVIKYKAVAITIYDKTNASFNYVANRNLDSEIELKIKNLIKDGLVVWAIAQKRSIAMPDMESNGGATFVIVPLITQLETVGAIFLYSTMQAGNFRQQEMEFLNILGAQIAMAIKNTFLYQEMGQKNQALANLKNYLDDVINNMVTGVVVLDMEGNIRTFNNMAAKFLYINSAVIIDRKYSEVLPASISSAFSNALKVIKANPDNSVFPEIEFDYNEPGKAIPIRLSYNMLRDNQHKLLGVIFMIQDMTESREIKRLREIDKIKSELVANVSHELRTPLTSIKAYAETLMDIAGTDEVDTQKEFLNIICQESDRLTSLISNLLDLSRLESGDFKLNKTPANIIEIVKKCAMLLKEHAAQKNVSIVLELPAQAQSINIDISKFEQVLINLISNSIKYNKPEDGKVFVTLKDTQNNFEITIKDTGIGIPEEALDKIFEKFYRVDTSLTYQVSGTGLGLAIVKHIIDLHGGKIFVESVLNEGSKFTVTLPKY